MAKDSIVKNQYVITGKQLTKYIFLSLFISILTFAGINATITGKSIDETFANSDVSLLFLISLIVFFIVMFVVYYARLRKIGMIDSQP